MEKKPPFNVRIDCVNCTCDTHKPDDNTLVITVKPKVLGPFGFLVAVVALVIAFAALWALALAVPALIYALSVSLL